MMKRMLLILTACLTLLWAQSAFAEGSDRDLIENVAALYDEYGEYRGWPVEAYQEAAAMLRDAGVIGDEGWASIQAARSQDVGNRLLDALPGVSSWLTKRVAIGLWGDEELWTLENAHWYTEMMRAHELLLETSRVYLLPGENAASIRELTPKAIAYIKRQHNVDCAGSALFYTYYAPRMGEAPRWKLVFCVQESLERQFTIEMDEAGEIIGCAMHQRSPDERERAGAIFRLSLEEQAEYARQFTTPMYGFPDSAQIQEEEAKTLARDALEERGISCESGSFNVYVSFVITGQEHGVYPRWAVYYTDAEEERLRYAVQLSAETGEVLNVEIQDWTIPGKA